MGKLRRRTEAAERGVEIRAQVVEHGAQYAVRELGGPGILRQRAREGLLDLLVLGGDLGALVPPDSGDALAQIGKCRHAVARLLGEISAAEERRSFRREKHRQRPAAGALREHLMSALVDLVEIGPLLAVDLDVDEKAVH